MLQWPLLQKRIASRRRSSNRQETGNRLDGAMLARTRAAGFLWKAFVEEEKGWTPDVVHPIALLLRLID
jgi:hypothetical protein